MSALSPSHDGPRITVIIAVYNGAATLARCLDSIASQTYPRTELVVMDGGSADGSVDILQAHSAQIAYWETQPDRGIYHAWNKALARASGNWIGFLGADDYFWTPDVLARLAPHLPTEDPAARLVYGQVAIVNDAGDVVRYEGRPWEDARGAFTSTMSIPHPGLLHHRSVFRERGGFDENFRIAADYDLLLRELPARPALFVPDVVTVGVQRGGVSYAPAAMPQMLSELARVREKHGLPAPNLLNMTSTERNMRAAALLGRALGPQASQSAMNALRRLAGRPR